MVVDYLHYDRDRQHMKLRVHIMGLLARKDTSDYRRQMDTAVLDLPFRGRWRVENSPARKIPSHGTTLFGLSHAIDFVAVDCNGRSAPWRWRSAVATEAPESFLGFGAPILAPVDGAVVGVHDGEIDHVGRRSQLTLIPYALGQPKRIRAGIDAVAGNRVVIALGETGPFVVLAHLRNGSIPVTVGRRVVAGETVGACGNSGNSTEPHLHLQVSDSTDWTCARGVPLAFRSPAGRTWVPDESEIVVV